MQQAHREQPITVIAVRNSSSPGWRILALDCELHDLSRQAREIGLDGREFRLVGHGYVNPDSVEWFVIDSARRGGWHQDRETHWFPIDEPLPKLPGTPAYADVFLSLKSIMYGGIAIAIEVGGETLDLSIDDIGDSPVLWVRFVQVLAAGGEPHAALAEFAKANFIVQDGPNPRLCRFHVEAWNEGRRSDTVDVLTDRGNLLHQFRNLAAAIADHPWFAHHFVCHVCLPDAEYERVSNAAELEWVSGVKAGRYPDDFDAENQFTAAKIVAEVPLPEDCAKLAEEQREMLRLFQIPREWLVRFGLASWVPTSGTE